jgi:hypothetical protein
LALGTLTSFISTTKRASSDRGIELRPEITNALIVGDQRQDLWAMDYVSSGNDTYNSNIWNYWGKDAYGYPIISSGLYDKHSFNIDISDIYEYIIDDIKSGQLGSTYNVEQGELLALLADGGRSNWEDYIEKTDKVLLGTTFHGSGLLELLDICGEGSEYNIVTMKGAVSQIKSDNWKSTSIYTATKGLSEAVNEDKPIGDRLFEKLEGYANEYLGRKFLVAPPVICSAIDVDSPYNIQLNWTESDGAWSDINPWGLNNTTMELFRLQDGRIKCMMKFDNNGSRVDMSNWDSTKYYQPDSGIIYVEATAEEIVFLDPVNRLYPRIVVGIDKPVTSDKVYLDQLELGYATTHIYGKMAAAAYLEKYGMINKKDIAAIMRFGVTVPADDTTLWDRYPMPMVPTSTVVPLKSNVLRYGPWYASSFATAGPTNVEIMQDLNPWTYGSTTIMNTAGHALADNQVMNQQVIEFGSITVPGAPAYNMGSTFADGAPEITNMDVSVGVDGLKTTYQLRTFTPDYNSFSKTRIDNLKKNAGKIRDIQRLNNLARINQTRTPTTNNALGTVLNRPDRYRRTSSHSFLISHTEYEYANSGNISNASVTGINQLYKTDRVINSVVDTEFSKCIPTFGAGSGDLWLRRAGVEIPGLYRPFTTKSGEASLMASFPTGVRLAWDEPEHPDMMHNYSNNSTFMFRGPVYNEALPPIMCGTLNPFMQSRTNPNSGDMIDIRDCQDPTNIYFTMGSGYGHDIEYVIRDGTYPLDLSIKYPETNYSSEEWYRSIGIKGPPVIVGWGFDVAGKPVPNYDEVAGSGGRSHKFLDNWLQKPNMWKAGPLDIRWDYKRGVWTSAPSYRIVRVKMRQSTLGWNNVINAEIVDDNIPCFDISGIEIPKYIALSNPMGYSSASGTYGWAVFNPDKAVGVSGNYTNYELLYWDNPTFVLQTYGPASRDGLLVGASGKITSATPSFSGYQDMQNNIILGGAAYSGQNYTCTYYQYNELYGENEFLPTTYPVVTLNGIMTGDTVAYIAGGNTQILPINNALDIADGIKVYITWNNSTSNGLWNVVNAEPYNTPITTISS